MADSTQGTPVVDIVRRGDDVLIRTAVHDLDAADVGVSVNDGRLEVRLPLAAMELRPPSTARVGEEEPAVRERPAAPPVTGSDIEVPLSARDEQSLWNAQKPLISEDRRTSLHLEGFSDEQANAIVEALGDDAAEEAQGGSATGSDDFPEHGGFPERPTDESGEGASGWERDES
jgi:hypothetical protein